MIFDLMFFWFDDQLGKQMLVNNEIALIESKMVSDEQIQIKSHMPNPKCLNLKS